MAIGSDGRDEVLELLIDLPTVLLSDGVEEAEGIQKRNDG